VCLRPGNMRFLYICTVLNVINLGLLSYLQIRKATASPTPNHKHCTSHILTIYVKDTDLANLSTRWQ
jgi:hypothetical protein